MTKDPIGISAGDVNLYRYVQNNPAHHADPLGLFTFQAGSSFTVSGFGHTATGEFGGVIDDKWNFNTIGTFGIGASVGTPGIQINPIQLTATNADTINDLNGPGFQTGFSFNTPAGFGGSLEIVGGEGYQGVSLGIGGGTPGFSFNNTVTATGLSDNPTTNMCK